MAKTIPLVPNLDVREQGPVSHLVYVGIITGALPTGAAYANIFGLGCILISADTGVVSIMSGSVAIPAWEPMVTSSQNVILAAAGLQIHGASSPLVKHGSTIYSRVNGILGVPLATGDMPSLATALNPAGNNPGNLAFDNGSVDPTTKSCRMYTFLIGVNPTTGATTLSVLCGNDFPKNRPVNVLTDVNLGDGTLAIVGFLYVKNESSAVFIPGTTDLDASGITTSYNDAFGYPLVGQIS